MADQRIVPRETRRENGFTERFMEPFARMRSGVDHLLEDFPSRLPAFQFGGVPAVEMTEANGSYKIAVEVPGIPPKDIDLQVDRDMLILRGEKKEEHQETESDYVISERSYGSFERRIAIPADGMLDQISAESSNGVLRITIPRNADAAPQRQRIEIQAGQEAD